MAILQTVWQKLSRKMPPLTSSLTEIPSPAPNEPLVFFDDTTHLHRYRLPEQYLPLSQLQDRRQIIEVRINDNNQSYQTLIMAIDVARGLLWLDDLFPAQRQLKIGDSITLRHHRNGEQLSFSSPIVARGDSFGANGLAILLPETLSYRPRRQHQRCDLSHNLSLTAKIRSVGCEPSYGNLQDLSLGGAGLRLAGNILGQLRHGALLPVCELSLSDELVIRCSARVRAFSTTRAPHRCTLISAEFVDLSPERQHQLKQFLYKVTHSQRTMPQEVDTQEMRLYSV